MHAAHTLYSVEEYLALEASSDTRHEYVGGQIYAMTGGSLRHNRICLNLVQILLPQLEGTPCQMFMNDVRLRVARENAYYYPDLMVICDGKIAGNDLEVDDAKLVVEITSPSSEGIDRREKRIAYHKLPGLQEYVVIAQDTRSVEIYRPQSGELGRWHSYEFGDDVEFASLNLQFPLLDLYRGTDLETTPH